MSSMIGKKFYETIIPYSTHPELSGEIIIKSDNHEFNRYMEKLISGVLVDMYYGNLNDFNLFK